MAPNLVGGIESVTKVRGVGGGSGSNAVALPLFPVQNILLNFASHKSLKTALINILAVVLLKLSGLSIRKMSVRIMKLSRSNRETS